MRSRVVVKAVRLICVVILVACSFGCNPVEFFRNPNVRGEPASGVWVEVAHPTLPLRFQIPDNAEHEVAATGALQGMGLLRDARGRIVLVDDWGIRKIFEGDGSIYAIEAAFAELTPENPGVNEASIAVLSKNTDTAETYMQFVRDVFLKELNITKREEIYPRILKSVRRVGRSAAP
jgi:hypothetical protein